MTFFFFFGMYMCVYIYPFSFNIIYIYIYVCMYVCIRFSTARLEGVNGTVGLHGDCDDKGCIRKQEIFESGKLRGGKGGSDGGAIARRPHSTKKKCSIFVSKTSIFHFNLYMLFKLWYVKFDI